MLCLSALPVMAALASHFRAQYLNGRVIGPQTYVAVIGGSGSGKGNCSALFKDMIEGNLSQHDALEWEKVKANQEERDKKANAKDKPSKYHPLRTVRAPKDFQIHMAFAENSIGLMLLMNRGLTMLDSAFVNKKAYSYLAQANTLTMMDILREHILLVVFVAAILAALGRRHGVVP